MHPSVGRAQDMTTLNNATPQRKRFDVSRADADSFSPDRLPRPSVTQRHQQHEI